MFFVVIYCFSSFSFTGWYREGDKMTYLTGDGYRVAHAWRESEFTIKFFGTMEKFIMLDQMVQKSQIVL